MVQALCERIIILDKGQIVADGDKGCILSDVTLLRTHGLLKSHQYTDNQSTSPPFRVPGSLFWVPNL
jgi:ABC-type dipeptide/oligopeptide/nickel transport system ATPase subunit